jgi:hypothetical protein
MIRIAGRLTDDCGFLDLLTTLTRELVTRFNPDQVWVIHIDNWFDHTWLKFSGNGAIASNFPSMFGLPVHLDRFTSVKFSFYQEKLTFPPFTPNRILGQWSYARTLDGYREVPLPSFPHSTRSKHSSSNIHRRIEDHADSACFIWYSGNTLKNGRGSIMVYEIEAERTGCWFAAFHRHNKWELTLTKDVSRSEIQKLIHSES